MGAEPLTTHGTEEFQSDRMTSLGDSPEPGAFVVKVKWVELVSPVKATVTLAFLRQVVAAA